ncbi:MAG: response regulator transcription factor [Pseudohongiellaceae bacterium]
MSDHTTNLDSVLIVEDHKQAAAILKKVVDAEFGYPDINTAYTFADGLKYLRERSFSMALIDLGLPDGNGIDLVRYASLKQSAMLSIVTTIFDDEEHLFDALRSGASGYLLKGHSPEELATYLKEAVDGRPALSPHIAQSMLGFFRQSQAKQPNAEQSLLEHLTPREQEILSLIARGCSVREVGGLLEISTNTVSHHIKSLYGKLNIHNRAEATAAAVQLNIFKPD